MKTWTHLMKYAVSVVKQTPVDIYYFFRNITKSPISGNGMVAENLISTCSALEDLRLVPDTNIRWLKRAYNSSYTGSDASSDRLRHHHIAAQHPEKYVQTYNK